MRIKIGVVSDTHSKPIPPQLIEEFKNVDLIVHAGDFCSLRDYEFFAKLKNIKAVSGNMDEGALIKKLPRRLIFCIESLKIGVFHGMSSSANVLKFVQEEFKEEKVNIVIFGHSHQPFNKFLNNVLYFNPGSPNDTLWAPYRSYGVLEIEKEHVIGHIIKVKD